MTDATPAAKGRPSRLEWFCFDNILTGVIAFLLVACPFAFGAVHQWAYTIVEIVVLSLVAAWLVLSITGPGGIERKCNYRGATFLVATAAGFLIVVGLQLVPMPLRMLRIVSPGAYELYFMAVTGPQKPPQPDSGSVSSRAAISEFVRPGLLGAAAANRSTTPLSTNQRNSIAGELISGRTPWRPISVAPSLTTYALVEGIVFTGLFLMVSTYRFDLGIAGETRFIRVILVTVTTCGALLAMIGIAEQAYWNGELLWFFVPHDWNVAQHTSFPRASGPFVDPDHFANYLGMIFPLAAGGTLFGLPGNPPTQRDQEWLATRVLFGLASFVILLAITLSFSRAIWLLTGLAILALGSFRLYVVPLSNPTARTNQSRSLLAVGSRRRLYSIGASLIVISFLLCFVGAFLGTTHDTAIALRLEQMAGDPGLDLGVRPALWRASIQMFKEHPLSGIGLGTWAEIFPHYESAPRLEMTFHQAHNDYLQLAAEVGMLGLIPLICAILWLGHIGGKIRCVSYDHRPFVLCLEIAIAVMLLHELVDFAMHITANALLFTVLLALAIRILSQANPYPGRRKATVSWIWLAGRVAFVGSIYCFLVYLAASEQNVGYPADIRQPNSVKTANEIISKHPASAAVYMDRFVLSGGANRPASDIDDLRSAVWLDPTNPYDRDLYAVALEEKGAAQESLQELMVSLLNSPDIRSHFYLDPPLLKRLRNDQREAIEEGLTEAITANEPGAIPALAWFHETLGDFGAEAALFESAARVCSVNDHRSQYYDLAGRAWIRAGRARDAVNDFRQAANDSSETQAYEDLLAAEVAEKESFASVNAVIESAVDRGANPAVLWSVLASAYQSAGDNSSAEKALLEGLNLDPSYEMLMRTGEFYLTAQHFDRATAMFRQAIEVSSESAAAYYYLGVSNEGAYEYFQADQAYARAAQLAPVEYGLKYNEFKKRLALAGQIK